MDCSMPGFPVLPPSSGACSQFCPLSQWFHPTLSSFVIPFCFHSFPASGSFLMSQLFASGGQGIGASASASVLLMNIQDWFPLGLAGLISFQSKGLSRVCFNTTAQKHVSLSWLKFMFTESVMLSGHLILRCPSSCLQSSPASGSFPVSWLFASCGQNIRASVSVLPVNTQCWFPLGLAGLISCGPRDSQESSLTPQLESINSLVLSLLYGPTLTSMHKH